MSVRACLSHGSALLCILLLSASARPAIAKLKGPYGLALIRVTYSDTTALYTEANLKLAAKEMEAYFTQLSSNDLALTVTVVEVTLAHPKDFYWTTDTLPTALTDDALQGAAAAAGIVDLIKINDSNGIMLLSTFPAGTYGKLDIVNRGGLSRKIDQPLVKGTFQFAQVFETVPPNAASYSTPGPSGVWWGSWAHELGHQLELFDKGFIYKTGEVWGGHPSRYNGGYELMDSCYPCGAGAYSLLDTKFMKGAKRVFNGWLHNAPIRIDAPSSGSASVTWTLFPLSLPVAKTLGKPQVLQVPVAAGVYYLVEARKRTVPSIPDLDSLGAFPGIWDEGVRITLVNESADPPVTNIHACDTVVAGGCIGPKKLPSGAYDTSDPTTVKWLANCPKSATTSDGLPHHAGDVPDYCWPFALWQPGETFTDAPNEIRIQVGSATAVSYDVTVIRGPVPTYTDMIFAERATKWPAPFKDFAAFDIPKSGIWIDSSCNGYEADVGAAGLRYGRPAKGKVLGGGDDPCANHENRIYAEVRNAGQAPALDVRIRFSVFDPLAATFPDCLQCNSPIGTADAQVFPQLASLDPGASTTVFVPWTPQVALTPDQINSAHFNLPTGVRVEVDPVAGELGTGNNGAVIALDRFEAVADASGRFTVPTRTIPLSNQGNDTQPFFLSAISNLPSNWSASVAGGQQTVSLAPKGVEPLEVKIQPPPKNGGAVGKTYLLSADILTVDHETDPNNEGLLFSPSHSHLSLVGRAIFAAQTVRASTLSLSASGNPNNVGAVTLTGQLSPAHSNAIVAIDYTDVSGNTTTRLVRTDRRGVFQDQFQPGGQSWTARAIWQGDLNHASAVSSPVALGPLCGNGT